MRISSAMRLQIVRKSHRSAEIGSRAPSRVRVKSSRSCTICPMRSALREMVTAELWSRAVMVSDRSSSAEPILMADNGFRKS